MGSKPVGNGQNTEKKHRRNTSGLKPPWPKGVSGNPGGRPSGKPLSDALMAALLGSDQKDLKAVVKAIVAKGKKGDVQAFNSMRDTIEGKPVQQLDVKGEIKGTVILSSVPRPQRTA